MTRRNFFKAIGLASVGVAIASTIKIKPSKSGWLQPWTRSELKRRSWYTSDYNYRAIHGAANAKISRPMRVIASVGRNFTQHWRMIWG